MKLTGGHVAELYLYQIPFLDGYLPSTHLTWNSASCCKIYIKLRDLHDECTRRKLGNVPQGMVGKMLSQSRLAPFSCCICI